MSSSRRTLRKSNLRPHRWILAGVAAAILSVAALLAAQSLTGSTKPAASMTSGSPAVKGAAAQAPASSPSPSSSSQVDFPVHSAITATFFYGGEASSADNNWQTNTETAWCGNWSHCFGGSDNPFRRQHNGDWPIGFKPKENPFYFALPCADFDAQGLRPDYVNSTRGNQQFKALTHGAPLSEDGSLLKNQWVKIVAGGHTVFAQWEDTGPFAKASDNNCQYIFGGPNAKPDNQFGEHAGIDVSPAVKNRLNMGGSATVSWQFVLPDQVPDGPWNEIVTTSGPYWP
jgi:hypothetical protein